MIASLGYSGRHFSQNNDLHCPNNIMKLYSYLLSLKNLPEPPSRSGISRLHVVKLGSSWIFHAPLCFLHLQCRLPILPQEVASGN